MQYIKFSIAKDFTDTPGGRYENEGDFSGESFRKEKLVPLYDEAVAKNKIILMNLDGCMGYPSSFLDESFGGLARQYPNENVLEKFKFVSEDQPGLIIEIEKMMKKGR